jgi:hypothetical protein
MTFIGVRYVRECCKRQTSGGIINLGGFPVGKTQNRHARNDFDVSEPEAGRGPYDVPGGALNKAGSTSLSA